MFLIDLTKFVYFNIPAGVVSQAVVQLLNKGFRFDSVSGNSNIGSQLLKGISYRKRAQ